MEQGEGTTTGSGRGHDDGKKSKLPHCCCCCCVRRSSSGLAASSAMEPRSCLSSRWRPSCVWFAGVECISGQEALARSQKRDGPRSRANLPTPTLPFHWTTTQAHKLRGQQQGRRRRPIPLILHPLILFPIPCHRAQDTDPSKQRRRRSLIRPPKPPSPLRRRLRTRSCLPSRRNPARLVPPLP